MDQVDPRDLSIGPKLGSGGRGQVFAGRLGTPGVGFEVACKLVNGQLLDAGDLDGLAREVSCSQLR